MAELLKKAVVAAPAALARLLSVRVLQMEEVEVQTGLEERSLEVEEEPVVLWMHWREAVEERPG